MADTNHSVPEKYAALQDLTVEELEKLLYTASPSDCEKGEAYYAAIEEVLLQKETENPTGRVPNIDDAWKSFQQNYSVPEARGLRLYEELSGSQTSLDKSGKQRRAKGLRRLLLVAATLAFVLVSSVVVQASGIDIFGAIARWTKEVFTFSTPAAETDEYGFMPLSVSPELTAALNEQGFPASFAPAWLPDAYNQFDVETYAVGSSIFVRFTAQSDSDESIYINFSKYIDKNAFEKELYEKKQSAVEEYQHGTQLFYIFHNTTGIVAVWSDGTYVISILGDLPVSTVEEIIDSI